MVGKKKDPRELGPLGDDEKEKKEQNRVIVVDGSSTPSCPAKREMPSRRRSKSRSDNQKKSKNTSVTGQAVRMKKEGKKLRLTPYISRAKEKTACMEAQGTSALREDKRRWCTSSRKPIKNTKSTRSKEEKKTSETVAWHSKVDFPCKKP